MDDLKTLIEQARALMICPVCGRNFKVSEIKFKGFMEHTFILQTSCSKNHPTVYTTWITSYVPTAIEAGSPIQSDHILDLHKALQTFDGDFKALWSKKGK